MVSVSVKPIYVLYGEDGFLLDAHRQEVTSLVVGTADPQTCIAQFDGDAELPVVLDELRTMPFLAPRRLVIIRDADVFVSAHREALENYLHSPASAGTLMLIVSSWPSNTRLYKLVHETGVAYDCGSAKGQDLGPWLNQRAAKRGKKIQDDAAELLVRAVGQTYAMLDGELEKLALYVGDRPAITAADVGQLVTSSAGPAAFALTNAVTRADTAGALRALHGMLTSRGEELKVLGSLGWHLRQALRAAQMAAQGKNPDTLLRMPFDQKREFLAMLRRRGLAAIQEDVRRLIRADLALKSGTDPTAVLQQLLVELCGPSPSSSPRASGRS